MLNLGLQYFKYLLFILNVHIDYGSDFYNLKFTIENKNVSYYRLHNNWLLHFQSVSDFIYKDNKPNLKR